MPITSPRASAKGYAPPPVASGEEMDRWRKQEAFNIQVLLGKLNVAKTVTLTASAASTTIMDSRIGATTAVILVPTTANAAAEIGNGTLYQGYPNAVAERAVLNHANNALTDRTFVAVLLG